jgi:hypothetical protein
MTLADGFRLGSLLGREHRIELTASATHDRIYLRLYPAAQGAHLPALPIHDRIDALLLRRRESQLARETLAEDGYLATFDIALDNG